MKKLLFIFLIIFSSHSFAKSVVGKVLYCPNITYYGDTKGFVFLDEENVEIISIKKQDIHIKKNLYETNLRNVKILTKKKGYMYSINRKTLKLFQLEQCFFKNSKEEVVNLMRNKIQEILDSNQL